MKAVAALPRPHDGATQSTYAPSASSTGIFPNMNKLKLLTLALCLTPFASAQFIGAGVKLGATPTKWSDKFGSSTSAKDDSSSFVVGPYVELRLPLGFAIEADGLYRSVGAITTANLANAAVNSVTDARSWEFPILAKYRFPTPMVKPFVVAGPSFRWVGQQSISATCTGTSCADVPSSVKNDGFSKAGFVLGGGLEWKLGAVRLSGEGRYTRYGKEALPPYFSTSQNQAQILFSIGF